jgi:hypothetical protein
MTTNYRQLKTIYHQRKNHRLPEWREFCEWILTLPLFKALCIKEPRRGNKPLVITISGQARHGKNSVAEMLKDTLSLYGERSLIINYADYLKYIATQYFGWNGKKDIQGRTLLQQLGTEKVRTKYPNFWVDTVIHTVEVLADDFDYVLIADCRFPNEIDRWCEEDFRVIPVHVERLNFDNGLTEKQKNHASETALNNRVFEVYLKAENIPDLKLEVIEKIMPLLGCDSNK